MGTAKRMMEDAEERGWNSSDKSVCPECIAEPYLKEAIRVEADSEISCDFCGSDGAASVDVFLEAFMTGVDVEFQDADNEGVPWDHGYQGAKTLDTWDIVTDEYGHVFDNEEFLTEVRDAVIDRTWAKRDGWRPAQDEFMNDGWDEFVQRITRRTRFVYWVGNKNRADRNPDEMQPGELLDSLAYALMAIDRVKDIPDGLVLTRARPEEPVHDTWRAADLGTNRDECARANRFNPIGIAMFYGAETVRTALDEVARTNYAERFTVGEFDLVGSAEYLDLTDLPEVNSEFHPQYGYYWRHILFLQRFISEVTKPADSSASAAEIGYVPTQVVAEFFLRTPALGGNVRGIRYRSSLTGKPCWVIDVDRAHCVDAAPTMPGDETYLRLTRMTSHARP